MEYIYIVEFPFPQNGWKLLWSIRTAFVSSQTKFSPYLSLNTPVLSPKGCIHSPCLSCSGQTPVPGIPVHAAFSIYPPCIYAYSQCIIPPILNQPVVKSDKLRKYCLPGIFFYKGFFFLPRPFFCLAWICMLNFQQRSRKSYGILRGTMSPLIPSVIQSGIPLRLSL